MIEYVVAALSIAAVIDRFGIRRKAVTDLLLGELEFSSQAVRIPFSFRPTRKRFRGAQVSYDFRDVKNPTTVITGRSRPLERGMRGMNSEYLYISRQKIHSPGKWVMTVRVVHGDSLWNPLYRIFPMEYVESRVFTIDSLEG